MLASTFVSATLPIHICEALGNVFGCLNWVDVFGICMLLSDIASSYRYLLIADDTIVKEGLK